MLQQKIAIKVVNSVDYDMKRATYKTPQMIAIGVLHYAKLYGLDREYINKNVEKIAKMVLIRLNGSI